MPRHMPTWRCAARSSAIAPFTRRRDADCRSCGLALARWLCIGQPRHRPSTLGIVDGLRGPGAGAGLGADDHARRRGRPVMTRTLWPLLTGFILWALAFIALYALQYMGCFVTWDPVHHRAALIGVYMLALVWWLVIWRCRLHLPARSHRGHGNRKDRRRHNHRRAGRHRHHPRTGTCRLGLPVGWLGNAALPALPTERRKVMVVWNWQPLRWLLTTLHPGGRTDEEACSHRPGLLSARLSITACTTTQRTITGAAVGGAAGAALVAQWAAMAGRSSGARVARPLARQLPTN